MEVKDFPLDHIGVAVSNLEIATNRYRRLYDVTILADEEVASQKVNVRFLKMGNTKIELLVPSSELSPVFRFLAKRGEGIHHLAFRVKDINAEMKRLNDEGFHVLQKKPIRGAMNKWVFFVHPKSMGGTLVEICQYMDE